MPAERLRFKRVNSFGQTGNLAGSLLPMNHTLTRDLVQSGRGIGQGLLGAFLIIVLNGGAHILYHVLYA